MTDRFVSCHIICGRPPIGIIIFPFFFLFSFCRPPFGPWNFRRPPIFVPPAPLEYYIGPEWIRYIVRSLWGGAVILFLHQTFVKGNLYECISHFYYRGRFTIVRNTRSKQGSREKRVAKILPFDSLKRADSLREFEMLKVNYRILVFVQTAKMLNSEHLAQAKNWIS